MTSTSAAQPTITGFHVAGARGIWYARADVAAHVAAPELDAYVASDGTTAMQLNNATCGADGSWRAGGPTEVLGDKFVRTRWPTLPYARPCATCGDVKDLADFPAALTVGTYEQVRAACRACARSGNAVVPAAARAAQRPAPGTDGTKTCNVCLVAQPLTGFAPKRATCVKCRNAQSKKLAAAKAEANPDLRICSGCSSPKPLSDFGRYKSCEVCRNKNRRV